MSIGKAPDVRCPALTDPRPRDTSAPAQSRGLLRTGALVGGLTFVSRILGLARDVVIAVLFGARPEADAFFVAFRIPNLFRRLFAEGAFSQGFIPVLAAYRQAQSHAEVRRFVGRVAGVLGLVLLLLTLIGILAAPLVIGVFAPGFEGSGGRHDLASEMLRITFPYLFLISLTALCAGVLNSYNRFAVPAITPVWLNLCLIAAALGLAGRLEEPIMALAWGVLVAGVVQFLFQLPALARIDMLVRPRLEPRDPGVRRVVTLMLPAAFGASVSQINLLIDTVLASFLVAGSISWLYYADRLMELPLGIFAIALATVLLPRLSREHAEGSPEVFSATLDQGMRLGLLVTVPAAAALVVLAEPLIATLFHYGAMGAEDVRQAAFALKAYALGLIGFTGVKILAPGFFARQDTRTPVRIALWAMAVNLVLNLALILPLAHVGLALATSVAALVNALLLLRGLRSEGVWRPAPEWRGFLLRLGGATAAMVALLWFVAPPAETWLAADVARRVIWMAFLVPAGVAAYFIVLALAGLGPKRLLRTFLH